MVDYAHKIASNDTDDTSKQRASKACNRCRARKAKCSGGYPCLRCKSSDAVCLFGYAKTSKRKVFPEHYVRTLEMQQFKLVAGLRTMYHMLLAAESWPGSQLPENKGNPLVHDILGRLGMLEPEKNHGTECDFDEDMSDTQKSDTDGASSKESSELARDEVQSSPKVQFRNPSALFQRSGVFQLSDQGRSLNAAMEPYQAQPVQSDPSLYPFELRPDSILKPPTEMAVTLSSTSPPSESLPIINWQDSDYPSSLWFYNPEFPLLASFPNVGPPATVPSTNMVNDANASTSPLAYYSSSYLMDAGNGVATLT